MNGLKRLIWLVIALAVVGAGVVWSGIIDVGATNAHSKPVAWLLHTATQRSVAYHARDIKVPPLDKPGMVMMGFHHYREMCVGCHLAPGISSSEIRKGLMPQPPRLQKVAKWLSPAELFWVIKNGVKMTGMPAWGATHSDDKLWGMVAFVKQLPDMTPEKYQELNRLAGPASDDDADAQGNHIH